ncbi:MAG: pentapeptide repeat-containing protein, partial [Myxococcota bacterium]
MMRALSLVWLGLWLALVAPARAADPVPSSAFKSIEDPRRLEAEGRNALASNDFDRARAAFTARLDRLEFATYVPLRAKLRDALLAESMDELNKAEKLYREAVEEDPLRVVLTLRIVSQHPKREELTSEVLDIIRQRGEAAKNGAKDALIYTTTKGAPRYLTLTTTQQVIDNARKGKATQYCYVDELDFSVVDDLPEEILLNRCVIGSVKGSGKAFGKVVLIRSFLLGDAIFGKVFTGERHQSQSLLPATFDDVTFRETVFMGDAVFASVQSGPGRAYFPLVVFEGDADFKGAEFNGVTDFRFASFGKGANFRLMRMTQKVYFGGARYRADT